MADDSDALVLQVSADLAPLFSGLEQGLRAVRDKIQSAREAGNIKLSADIDGLLRQLAGVTPQVEKWAKDASGKAEIKPTVDTEPLTREMAEMQHDVTYTLSRAFDVSPFVSRMVSNASAMESAWLPAARNMGTALKAMDFAGAAVQVKGFYSSLQTAASGLGFLTKGLLVAGAAYAGWQIGTWINEVTGLRDALNDAGHTVIGYTEAELEAERARMESKYGIDMTIEALRIFIQLSAETRNAIIQQAVATGNLTITVNELNQAIKEQTQAQQSAYLNNLWDNDRASLQNYIEYYKKSRKEQIALDIAANQEALLHATSLAEQNRLMKERDSLNRQASQEATRKSVSPRGGAVQSADTGEAARVAKANEDAANRAADAWAGAQAEMAVAAMDAMNRELAAIDKKEAKYKEELYAATADAQAIRDGLIQIEEDKQRALAEIKERYRQQELQKAQAAIQKEQQEAEASYNRARTALQAQMRNMLDPIGAMVESAYNSLNQRATAFAETFRSMVAPLQSAFNSLLMGMKVNWGNVLRQMIVQFAMVFVNQFLAWVGTMIMQWITGETTKTAATATGAAARVGITAAETAATTTLTVAALDLAVAEIFAAHAGIPFAGVSIATGFVAQMMATYAAFAAMAQGLVTASKGAAVAFAEGGWINQPTYALMGEAGERELVAPETSFTDAIREVIINAREGMPALAPAGGGSLSSHLHLHGVGFTDTGDAGLVRALTRKINKTNKELTGKSFKGARA